MKIDATLPPVPLTSVPQIARSAEEIGFDALWSTETIHDPFLPGALIAEHTQRLNFGTAVAIAFSRSPANLAYTAWDLSQMSGGRFILGLGTQVKAHIVRRYGMPWPDSAVGKLREQIGAIRSFWKTWQTGERLDFRGEYYRLSLMTPFFNPGLISHPDIPIYIAGVNTGLARLASEVADGFLVHPLHTSRYLQEVLIPTINQGLTKVGKSRCDFNISATVFVVILPSGDISSISPGEDSFVRAQISFYASTPSYKPVMALHGWEDIAQKLSELAHLGQWGEMPSLIDNQILSTVAIVSTAKDLPEKLKERYKDKVDRLGLYLPFIPGEQDIFWKELVNGLKSDP